MGVRRKFVGRSETAEVRVVGDCFGLSVDFDVSTFTDPATMIEIEALMSNDHGQSWTSLGKSHHRGGVHFDTQGIPLTRVQCEWSGGTAVIESGNVIRVTPPGRSPRIKCVVSVTGEVTTDIDVAAVKLAPAL